MNTELLKKIDKKIEDVRDALASTTVQLVNIKSVQEEPLPGAPFGAGPRAVLDAVLQMGREAGFACTDYGVGVVSLARKEGQPDLGVWLHGDVVPEGNGWRFPPYDATEHQGHIIGRGATDNKGQLATIFHLLKIFDELGIELKYNPALYVGSNEETGMKDMLGIPGNPDARGFINVCTPPRLSLVPDGGFPVGYGGKGSMMLFLTANQPLSFTFTAGLPETPGRAQAEINGVTVTAQTPPVHGSHPDARGNMITALSRSLLKVPLITPEERSVLEFFRRVSLDTKGEVLGIATDDPQNPVTVFSKRVTCDENGYPTLMLNIRYPDITSFEEILEKLAAVIDGYGFTVKEVQRGWSPYKNDPESEIVQLLHRVAGEVTGSDKQPYIVTGGTYAHQLPNAYVFGMDGNHIPEDFPEGYGNAHGIDEAVSLDRLQRAMRIYARALLALNEINW